MNATKNDSAIWISDNDFQPEWVLEYGTIPTATDSNFPKKTVCAHKLAIITSLDDDFVSDLDLNLDQYLWNQSSDTVLGKPVHISEFMPKDGKHIAFSDFSYYTVIDRIPLSVRILYEK